MDMNKLKKMAIGSVAALAVVGLSGCADTSKNAESEAIGKILEQGSAAAVVPSRSSEINGVIAAIEGNVVVVKNEIGKEILSEVEQAAKKAERAAMTQEERQALRAEEMQGVATQDVEITIPVGIPLYKGSGTGDGTTLKAEFSELKKGAYISVWQQGDRVEAVKIKGIN